MFFLQFEGVIGDFPGVSQTGVVISVKQKVWGKRGSVVCEMGICPDWPAGLLAFRYSRGVLSPGRHVRTRLYFTSESHVHSLLSIFRYGGLLDVSEDPAPPSVPRRSWLQYREDWVGQLVPVLSGTGLPGV